MSRAHIPVSPTFQVGQEKDGGTHTGDCGYPGAVWPHLGKAHRARGHMGEASTCSFPVIPLTTGHNQLAT